MMFIETRLLDKVSYGSSFSHFYDTRIKTLRNGREVRNINWPYPKGRYRALYEHLNESDHSVVIHAHRTCYGSAVGFRFKDWTDYKAELEFIGTGTGSAQTLQLVKNYQFGSTTVPRPIKKPVAGTVRLYELDNVDNAEEIVFTMDYTTGLVNFTASSGAPVVWTGEFDVPVRFQSDELETDVDGTGHDGFVLTSDVDLIEVW